MNGTAFKNHYIRTRWAVKNAAFEAFECLEALNHLWAMTTHGHADWTWAMYVSSSGESWCEQRLQQIPQGLDDQSAMFHYLLRELRRPEENSICLWVCCTSPQRHLPSQILVISRFCQPVPFWGPWLRGQGRRTFLLGFGPRWIGWGLHPRYLCGRWGCALEEVGVRYILSLSMCTVCLCR